VPVISYLWRGTFTNAELNALHAEGFGYPPSSFDWRAQLERHSLGWVCARESAGADQAPGAAAHAGGGHASGGQAGGGQADGGLAGFVNVAWDGSAHAFVLDTLVSGRLRRQGIGRALVARAAREARAAGCEWLHVDFEDHLRPFYFASCGFSPTNAGLIDLTAATR
jgi:GNAT superfamily N-acetyltransferase